MTQAVYDSSGVEETGDASTLQKKPLKDEEEKRAEAEPLETT